MANFIPDNTALQELLNKEVDPDRFASVFDTAFALRQKEQSNALSIFKSIAATNPALAQFLMGQPGVASALTQTPKLTGPKAGDVLGEAAKGYTPPAKSTLKPTTATATVDPIMKYAEGFKNIGVNPPPQSWAIVQQKLAAGLVPTAQDFNVDGDTLFAAMASVGEGKQGLLEKLYDATIKARGIDQIPDAKTRTDAEGAVYRELQGKLSPEAFNQLHNAQMDRLNQVYALGKQEEALKEQQLTRLTTQPATQAEIANAEAKGALYQGTSSALTRVINKLTAAAAGDQTAQQTLVNEILAIPKTDDPFLSLVASNVLQAITTFGASDDATRAATAATLKEQLTQLRQQVNSIGSKYGSIVKSGSKKGQPQTAPSNANEIFDMIQKELSGGEEGGEPVDENTPAEESSEEE